MSKLTIQTQVTFGMTSILCKEAMQAQYEALVAGMADENTVTGLSAKQKVFAKLCLQAYDKEGLEGFSGALIQYCMREEFNTFVREEIACKSDTQTNKVTPVRVQLLEVNHEERTAKKAAKSERNKKAALVLDGVI